MICHLINIKLLTGIYQWLYCIQTIMDDPDSSNSKLHSGKKSQGMDFCTMKMLEKLFPESYFGYHCVITIFYYLSGNEIKTF